MKNFDIDELKDILSGLFKQQKEEMMEELKEYIDSKIENRLDDNETFFKDDEENINNDPLFVRRFIEDKWNEFSKEHSYLISLGLSDEEIEKTIKTKITKKFLQNNPVKSQEEFMRLLIMIKPTADKAKLFKFVKSKNFKENDVKSYNEFLLWYYDMFDKINSYNSFIESFDDENETYINYKNYKGKNLLGEYIEKNGIRLAWLSNKTGIPRSTLESMARNSDSMPTVDKAIKICKVLGEDIETLFPLERQESNEE